VTRLTSGDPRALDAETIGAKGYGNLVELAALQHHVAIALGHPAGRLLMTVKPAHIYDTDLAYIAGLLPTEGSGISASS
jgi:thymidylate synthase